MELRGAANHISLTSNRIPPWRNTIKHIATTTNKLWLLCKMTWSRLLAIVLLFELCSRSHSALIIDEDFDNLDAWNQDKSGVTATIKIVPSDFAGTQSMLSTNVSYCGNDSCYRAEITTPPAMRPSVISGTTGVYWFGFSNYIPADWAWLGQTTQGYSEVIYYFQFHGGDNNGQPPVWGLRNIGPPSHLSPVSLVTSHRK
jgi:hypothetical protein